MHCVELTPIDVKGPEPALVVHNAYKRYTKEDVILNRFCMTVPSGTIYGLLGPSGCGKTTLFRCIVGEEKLDDGHIQLNVSRRSQLGYMPQSLSLHMQLTIFENIFFYAYLFGMTKEDARLDALKFIHLLDLPPGERLLSELSGGQQRRVSLAVTFIHDPEIFILDEPTVGLDPIVTKNIWKWFLKIANSGKTIIITTHYVQEAYHAHKIGLMRDGILLTESDPSRLMHEFETDSLETVFQKLSYKQDKENRNKNVIEYPEGKPVQVHFENEIVKSAEKFKALVYKNKNLMKRDIKLTLFIILLPTIVVWIAQLAIGKKPQNIQLAVVNEESLQTECKPSSYHKCFLDDDDDDNNNTVLLSCLYLDFLQKRTYVINEYTDEDAAQRDIHNRQVAGLLRFSKNYTKSFRSRINNGHNLRQVDIDASSPEAWIDFSNPFTGNVVHIDMVLMLQHFIKKVLTSCGLNSKIGLIPLVFEDPVHGTFGHSLSANVNNIVMCLATFATPALYAMLHVYSERAAGVNERIRVTGVSMLEIMTAALLVLMVVYVIQIILILVVVYCMFQQPLEGSLGTVIFLFLLHGVVGNMFGFLLGFIFNNLVIGTFTAGGSLISLAIVSGIGWPAEAQHSSLKSMQWFFVGVKFIEAVRGINMKGYKFSQRVVFNGFMWEVGWILIYSIITYVFIRSRR